MKLYEFYKKDHLAEGAQACFDLVGNKHQYLAHGIVIFHTLEYKEEPTEYITNGGGTEFDKGATKKLEEENFIPYHAFDRIEITEVEDV